MLELISDQRRKLKQGRRVALYLLDRQRQDAAERRW